MIRYKFLSIFEPLFNIFKSKNIECNNSASNMLQTDDDLLLFDKKISEMREKKVNTAKLTLSDGRKVTVNLK